MSQERAWLPETRDWTRTYGRFNPDQEPFASLIFEQAVNREGARKSQSIVHLDVLTERPAQSTADEVCVFNRALGWVRALPFPADRSIPTIASVLTDGEGTAMIVRYRPGRRCTMRFDNGGHSRFAKVYPNKFARHDRGPQMLAATTELWQAAARRELQFVVARPLGWDGPTRSLWQERVEGTLVLSQLFSDHGEQLARRIGTAAASLLRSDLRPSRTFDATQQMAASIRSGKELSTRVAAVTSRVDALLDQLKRVHRSCESRSLPIHGDLDARQWIYDGHRLGLTDFDDFAFGDPELDAATFLAELEFEARPPDRIQQLNQAFLSGYESAAGLLNRRLLAAYLAHKRIYKALRVARALDPDGGAHAESILVSGSQALMQAIESND
jgi:hypothetical protein